jgi:hypothetical protein
MDSTNDSRDPVPESTVSELLTWIAYERDAAWAAKLAILRMTRREDIAMFGEHLREHDRHASELAQLVRAADPRCAVPDEPQFLVRDALVIGALDGDEAVVAAMKSLEESRIARYERRGRRTPAAPTTMPDAMLDRHLADARARLAGLRHRAAASVRKKLAA